MRVHVYALAAGFAGLLIGCGSPSAKISGRITCQGKPVKGVVLFSPQGENDSNKGPSVSALVQDDGSYELQLTTIGKHMVVVTPSDVKYPVPPGEFDYPCARSAIERDVKEGDNKIMIEMNRRGP